MQRRSGDDSQAENGVFFEGDQRSEHRHAADVISCPIDRIDDPSPRAEWAGSEFFADDAI
jgi:hypothetical protein